MAGRVPRCPNSYFLYFHGYFAASTKWRVWRCTCSLAGQSRKGYFKGDNENEEHVQASQVGKETRSREEARKEGNLEANTSLTNFGSV